MQKELGIALGPLGRYATGKECLHSIPWSDSTTHYGVVDDAAAVWKSAIVARSEQFEQSTTVIDTRTLRHAIRRHLTRAVSFAKCVILTRKDIIRRSAGG